MTKKRVSIDFCDFHPNFPKTDNFYINLLRERFDVRLCDQPDFLLYGCYGHEHRLHTGVRIYVPWESIAPDYNVCDYSIGCLKVDDSRHLQLPYYLTHGGLTPEAVIRKAEDPKRILAGKTKFCSFVVSSADPKSRTDFFHKLSIYKKVDSGGRILNNIGGPIPGYSREKIEYLRAYKFNIAFENAAIPGYTTEKIFEAMAARCLPIYRGNPLIAEEFNPKSFLNLADFPSEEALIEKIIELDQDDEKYIEYAGQPYFINNEPNRYCSRERVLEFFERVFSQPIVPAAERKKSLLPGRWKLAKSHRKHPSPWPGEPGKD